MKELEMQVSSAFDTTQIEILQRRIMWLLTIPLFILCLLTGKLLSSDFNLAPQFKPPNNNIQKQIGTWFDGFDDKRLKEWETFQQGRAGEWVVNNDELWGNWLGGLAPLPVIWILIGDETWQNYTLQAKVKIRKVHPAPGDGGSSFSCDVYIKNFPGNYNSTTYILTKFGDSWQVGAAPCINGKCLVLLRHFALELNRWYHFKIAAEASNFRFSIDDQLIHQFSAPVTSGRVGFHFWAVDIAIDDILIRGENIPNHGRPPEVQAVSPAGKLAIQWGDLKDGVKRVRKSIAP